MEEKIKIEKKAQGTCLKVFRLMMPRYLSLGSMILATRYSTGRSFLLNVVELMHVARVMMGGAICGVRGSKNMINLSFFILALWATHILFRAKMPFISGVTLIYVKFESVVSHSVIGVWPRLTKKW